MSSHSDTPSRSAAERQLTEGLLRGEAAAQEQFLRQFAAGVFQLIVRIVPNTQDAEELTQDALFRALRGIQHYDPQQASLGTWLHRIAYRLTLNHLRRQPSVISLVSEIPDTSEPPAFSDDSLVPLLHEALDYLPPDEQTLVHLFYYDDLPLSEIAYIIEAPPGTIATRLHRIRQKLHSIIQKLQQQ